MTTHTGSATKICTVDGCESLVHGKGLCNKHYFRLRTRGTTDYRPMNLTPCAADDCDRMARLKGHCDVHDKQLKRYGEIRPIGARARRGLSRDELITELEMLAGTDTPENIARRLGYEPRTLARLMQRYDRPDLGAKLTVARLS